MTECTTSGTSTRCVLLSCLNGFDNCDGNPANGCEPWSNCNLPDASACDGSSAACQPDEPECGNGEKEPGEECDGELGCGECMWFGEAERQCMERFVPGSSDPDCQVCACERCLLQTNDCRLDTDTSRGVLCDALIECAMEEDCTGNGCYCGSAGVISCGVGAANGPCVTEIEAAARTTNPTDIAMRMQDPQTALGRASVLGECMASQCPDVCP